MCNAAGELADGLHLLGLLQRRLRPVERLHLIGEPSVGCLELGGALGDAPLERLGKAV